jgi:hypothetical protein
MKRLLAGVLLSACVCVPAMGQSLAYDEYRAQQKFQQAINNEVNRVRIQQDYINQRITDKVRRDTMNNIANQLRTQGSLGSQNQQIKSLQQRLKNAGIP